MTYNEAIRRCDLLINGYSVSCSTNDAFKDENKGYMTFETMREFAETCKQALEDKAKVQEFEAIGTIDEFKDLKEKSVAKKPHSISIANDIGNSMVECPICHARSDYDVKSIKRGYCWKCGQKLDWS